MAVFVRILDLYKGIRIYKLGLYYIHFEVLLISRLFVV